MARGRKQVSFDLDTNMLKEYYPNHNWRKAYDNNEQEKTFEPELDK